MGHECKMKNYVHFLNSESPPLLEFSDGTRPFRSRKTSIRSQSMSTQIAEHIDSVGEYTGVPPYEILRTTAVGSNSKTYLTYN